MFKGVSVALVTPFSGGVIDESALRDVIQFVLEQNVNGLVATGSTGEAAVLTDDEKLRVWEIVLEEARGRVFVLAGTGTNSTAKTVELTHQAKALGVDGCMLVTPYYNKPSQDGLTAHFKTVADAVDIPLMLYNVPGRTGVNLLPKTVATLAGHERIVAVKDASGTVDQATEILASTDLTVLSGEDALALPMAAAGAHGVVSVAGHIVGRELVDMLEHLRAGRIGEAARLHQTLFPLIEALFAETNPVPVKAALSLLGLIQDEVRLPLVRASEETRARIKHTMSALDLHSAVLEA